jgi:hypothetical protein
VPLAIHLEEKESMADLRLNDDAPPVEPIGEEIVEEEVEEKPHPIDPALLFIIFVIVTLLGLTNLAAEVRYTLMWTVLSVLGLAAIVLNRVTIERPDSRSLLTGLGFGALIGVPLMAVGSPQLRDISLRIFGRASDAAVFQMLAFTMPLAETLYFRAAFQDARGLIFAGTAAGIWSLVLFSPQMDVFRFPLVAVVIALCFIFVNYIYSYLRERLGLFGSWICQIAVNLLLLFAVRFM